MVQPLANQLYFSERPRRKIILRRTVFSCVACLLHAFSSALCARELTVDDILRMQNVGRSILSNDGNEFVFEWMFSYQAAPNLDTRYDLDRGPNSKLFSIDTRNPTNARPLFEQQENGGYWIASQSPRGLRIAIYSLISGRLRAGVYDLRARKVSFFSFVPSYSHVIQRPIWISEDELIYSTVSRESVDEILGAAGLIKKFNEQWRKSFRGAEASTTVVQSGRFAASSADDLREGMLVRVNLTNGAARSLAKGYFYNFRVSPTGRYLAALREGGHMQPESDGLIGDAVNGAKKELVVIDLKTESDVAVPCPACSVVPGTINWGDDETLYFFSPKVGESPRQNGNIYRYLIRSNSLQQISVGKLQFACGIRSSTEAQIQPLADGVVVLAREPDDAYSSEKFSKCDDNERFDWFLIRRGASPRKISGALQASPNKIAGRTEAAIFELNDGAVWRISDSGIAETILPRSIGIKAIWEPSLLLSLENAYTGAPFSNERVIFETDKTIEIFNLHSYDLLSLPKPTIVSELVAMSKDLKTAVFRKRENGGAYRLLLTGRKGLIRPILDVNAELRSVAAAREVQLSYEAADGRILNSCMLLPTNISRSTRPPLIVEVYPGMSGGTCYHSQIGELGAYNLQLLAARGYAVLFPATPGDLISTSEGPTRGLTALVMQAVSHAVRSDYVDQERIGVLGYSQGYHSALQLLTETKIFKTAVIVNGISDFASHYGTNALSTKLVKDTGNFSRYESKMSDNWMGAKPWEDPDRYIRNSPVFSADKITTPLLIMHSDLDMFPSSQSDEIFSALYRLRKDAVYVSYWGEAHSNLSPANIRDMWSRIFAWFEQSFESSVH